jgi:hypothetical protein
MRNKKPKPNPQPSSQFMVDKDALARLAYELYVRRGGEPGHDVEDWLLAEQMLIEKQKRPAPHRRTSDSSRRLEADRVSWGVNPR